MRASILRAIAASLLISLVAISPVCLAARQTRDARPGPRVLLAPTEPEIRTGLEALLSTPDVMLATDFYAIDTRFVPSVSMDAVVVTATDSQSTRKGLRIQVRDDGKPAAHVGVSFVDIEEIPGLAAALTSMVEVASKWTLLDEQRATQLSFTTTGAFHLDIHAIGRTPRASISGGVLDPVTRPVELVEFGALRQAVDQALAILNGK